MMLLHIQYTRKQKICLQKIQGVPKKVPNFHIFILTFFLVSFFQVTLYNLEYFEIICLNFIFVVNNFLHITKLKVSLKSLRKDLSRNYIYNSEIIITNPPKEFFQTLFLHIYSFLGHPNVKELYQTIEILSLLLMNDCKKKIGAQLNYQSMLSLMG